MDEATDRARKDALAFLKRHKTGVLGTVSPAGDAHASMVYYTADDDFNVYFLTLPGTRKYQALSAHPQVAFTVSVADVPATLQLEGTAMDISLDPDIAAKKDALMEVLNSNQWFYGPVAKLNPANVAVVWIRPRWVRWANYAFANGGADNVLQEIPLA